MSVTDDLETLEKIREDAKYQQANIGAVLYCRIALQHHFAEAFERRVSPLLAKLNAESAEIGVDRDRLGKVSEQ